MRKLIIGVLSLLVCAGAFAENSPQPSSVLDFSRLQIKQAQLQASLDIKKLQAQIADEDFKLSHSQGMGHSLLYTNAPHSKEPSSNADNRAITPVENNPQLQAILGSQGHYLARVSVNGRTWVVKSGDHVATWQVQSINESGVNLLSSDGQCHAHLADVFPQQCQSPSKKGGE